MRGGEAEILKTKYFLGQCENNLFDQNQWRKYKREGENSTPKGRREGILGLKIEDQTTLMISNLTLPDKNILPNSADNFSSEALEVSLSFVRKV